MQNRLIQMGNKGFNLNAIAGWDFEPDAKEPILILYLSGMSKAMRFQGEEAEILQKLLKESSQRI